MEVTMIPFALRASDHAFVEVSEVPSGLAANCICPSCRMPLIARRGDVKVWHFAHATRATYTTTQNGCDYSFFVSVRMMARQVIDQSIHLVLPSMEGLVTVNRPGWRPFQRPYTVTQERTVHLVDARVEQAFGDVIVDVIGLVGDVPLVLYFLHPGRPLPVALMATAQMTGRCGVVLIDLSILQEQFLLRQRSSAESFLDVLRAFLTTDVQHKKWLYHPRNKQMRAQAEAALLEDVDRHMQHVILAHAAPPAPVARCGNIRYECVLCSERWTGNAQSRTCPKCREHLYSREVDGGAPT